MSSWRSPSSAFAATRHTARTRSTPTAAALRTRCSEVRPTIQGLDANAMTDPERGRMSKYGPHGEQVAEFLDEVRGSEPDVWTALVERVRPSTAQVEAVNAVVAARLSASVQAAVDADAVAAFRSLELSPDDFPGRRQLMRIDDAINAAAFALAAGDQVAPEHAVTLLRPFADVGFTPVVEPLATRTV